MITNGTNICVFVIFVSIRVICLNKKADTRVWDIGLLNPMVHLLSKHGRYSRFQPCPDGHLPCPPSPPPTPQGGEGKGEGGVRKRARRFYLIVI